MSSAIPARRPNPTTDRESALLDALADLLRAADLTVAVRYDRRELLATQPAVNDDSTPLHVGLSQAVNLVRHRTDPAILAWVIRFDDGFRGADGAAFEPIADGDDLAEAARRVGNILALAGPATGPHPADRESAA